MKQQAKAAVRALGTRFLHTLGHLPRADHEWYEAAVSAALDETGGNLGRAMDLADALYAREGAVAPAGDDEEDGDAGPPRRKGYDPNEARDPGGKWAAGAGGGPAAKPAATAVTRRVAAALGRVAGAVADEVAGAARHPLHEKVGGLVAPVRVLDEQHTEAELGQARDTQSLTRAARAALRAYSGDAYTWVNGAMMECPPDFRCLKDYERGVWEGVEDAVRQLGPFRQPVPLWRGIHCDPAKADALLSDAEAAAGDGREFHLPTLTSTSLDASVVLAKFAQDVPGRTAVAFRIRGRSGVPMQGVSEYGGENEVLQSARTPYRVARVVRDQPFQMPDGTTVQRHLIELEEKEGWLPQVEAAPEEAGSGGGLWGGGLWGKGLPPTAVTRRAAGGPGGADHFVGDGRYAQAVLAALRRAGTAAPPPAAGQDSARPGPTK